MSKLRMVYAVWSVHAHGDPSTVLRGVAWTRAEAERQGRAVVASRLAEGYMVMWVPLLEGASALAPKVSHD